MQSDIRAASGRDRAYEHLRAALLGDPSLAGTFINEQAVARDVGVSRTPVREALLLLATEGLVQLLPHRGAFVPPLTPEEIRQILEARAVIETWAVRESLRGGRNPVAAMQARLDEHRAMIATEATGAALTADSAEFIRIDREFHTHLVEAGGNPVMTRMYETLRTRHVPIGVAALERNTARRRGEVIDEHRAIVDALAAHDVERAVAAVEEHLARTRRMLVHG